MTKDKVLTNCNYCLTYQNWKYRRMIYITSLGHIPHFLRPNWKFHKTNEYTFYIFCIGAHFLLHCYKCDKCFDRGFDCFPQRTYCNHRSLHISYKYSLPQTYFRLPHYFMSFTTSKTLHTQCFRKKILRTKIFVGAREFFGAHRSSSVRMTKFPVWFC